MATQLVFVCVFLVSTSGESLLESLWPSSLRVTGATAAGEAKVGGGDTFTMYGAAEGDKQGSVIIGQQHPAMSNKRFRAAVYMNTF
jgi:hypothetical protein